MATGMEQQSLSNYYSQWGTALGSAAGGLLGSLNATTTVTDSSLIVGSDYAYTYPYQQYYTTIGIQQNAIDQMIQPLVDRSQKVASRAKSILQSLRDEMHSWCSNILEVA
jgi:hypothetical protein